MTTGLFWPTVHLATMIAEAGVVVEMSCYVVAVVDSISPASLILGEPLLLHWVTMKWTV